MAQSQTTSPSRRLTPASCGSSGCGGSTWAKEAAHYGIPAGAVSIHWFVTGPEEGDSVFEGAPFTAFAEADDEHFLTHYTWPTDPATGERVQFSRLEVNDRAWSATQADKGGFIQQITGWKPGPLTPWVDVTRLARAAGLPGPRLGQTG